MVDVVDFEHIREAKGLFGQLQERLGLGYFLRIDDPRYFPQLDPARLEDTLVFSAAWLDKETGREVSDATLEALRVMLRRQLLSAVARGLLRRGL